LARWWEGFGDPTLTDLVRRAIEGNQDVRAALSRIRKARATVRSNRSFLRPTVDASGSVRVTRAGSSTIGGGTTDSYSLGLDASWELDVFGGIQSTVDAAAATEEAREADLETSSSAYAPRSRSTTSMSDNEGHRGVLEGPDRPMPRAEHDTNEALAEGRGFGPGPAAGTAPAPGPGPGFGPGRG
jgi:hypothetical protein